MADFPVLIDKQFRHIPVRQRILGYTTLLQRVIVIGYADMGDNIHNEKINLTCKNS